MRLHYVQHVPFEDAANIRAWADERGHEVSCTRLYEGDELPGANHLDWVVIMGGPMNVYEHQSYPWLLSEREFIRHAVQYGVPMLGVCLGAQLLADFLRGTVERNAHKEIGWFPVRLTEDAQRSAIFRRLPAEFMALHWHGDTFAIPHGALHVATSAACANQAFQYGDRVIGLQFHLDYTPESVRKMIQHCGDELQSGPFVQSAEAMLACPQRFDQTKALLYQLLDDLHEQTHRSRGGEVVD